MPDTPQVSVVIPLYNKAHHISRAIDSVIGQTYSNFELIIVDDGSTDDSKHVVNRCSDPRKRLIEQANAGVSAARNRGVQEASADKIAFLDADDEWRSDFLETVVKLSDRFPQAAVWATAYSAISADGKKYQPEFRGVRAANPEGGLIEYFRASGPWMPVHASAIMVKKEALIKAGGFPLGIRCGEDWDTWIRLALRYPIAWSPKSKAVIHQDAENRSENYLYTGEYPFFKSLRLFYDENFEKKRISLYVYQHVARCHIRLVKSNWLAGRRDAARQILRDCMGIKGFRLRCFGWRLLLLCPHAVVSAAWRIRQSSCRRKGKMPAFREITKS
jgi:glycosyltransferase involved in cell wall biosynthesis